MLYNDCDTALVNQISLIVLIKLMQTLLKKLKKATHCSRLSLESVTEQRLNMSINVLIKNTRYSYGDL